MCKLVEFSGEVALSEDGLALLLCPEEGQVKEFDSVVAWRRCVWLDVRVKVVAPARAAGSVFSDRSWVLCSVTHSRRLLCPSDV